MKTENPLKTARKKRGLTQREAAKIMGVSLSTVYFWEAGEKAPGPDNLRKIKKYFKVEPSAMLGI